MMIKRIVIGTALILCLCLLPSCTQADPAADDTDIPQSNKINAPDDDSISPDDNDTATDDDGSVPDDNDTATDDDGSVPDDEDTLHKPDKNSDRADNDETASVDHEDLQAVGSDTDETGADSSTNAVDEIRNVLKNTDTPVVNDELIKLFFDYQNESHEYKGPHHRYELRLLPQFGAGAGKAFDWDGLTVFVYHMANHFEHDDEGNYFFPEEVFDRTADRLLPDLEYNHKSSGFFDYAQGIYMSTGWDMLGGVYYRLKDISRDGDGVYTVSFDGFSFHELDTFEASYNEVSENMKAVFDYTGDRKTDAKVAEILLEIFQEDNYDEILHVNENVEITFRLSSDPEFAFEYLSCDREYIE